MGFVHGFGTKRYRTRAPQGKLATEEFLPDERDQKRRKEGTG